MAYKNGVWVDDTSNIFDPETDTTQDGFYVPPDAPEGVRAYTDKEQGAEWYNEQQQGFESGDTLGQYEQKLKAAAAEKGVEYDPSDLAGLQRNAGYDAAHLGSEDQWKMQLDKYFNNALQNYDERATNDPRGNDGGNDSGARLRSVGGAGSSSSSSGGYDWLEGVLKGIGTDGQLNQDVVNRRLDGVRDTLNQNKRSTIATNQAALAARGLIGDGPEMTARNSVDSRTNELFNNAYNNIYAEEAGNADQRQMDALRTAAGLSQGKDATDLGWFNANTARDLGYGNLDLDRLLGTGNLALGNLNAMNNYNLGIGDLQLRAGIAEMGFDQQTIDRIMDIIENNGMAAGISSGGINT